METLKNSKKQSTRNEIARKEKISNSKIYVHEKEKKTGRKRKIVASICHHKRRKNVCWNTWLLHPRDGEKKGNTIHWETWEKEKKHLYRRVRKRGKKQVYVENIKAVTVTFGNGNRQRLDFLFSSPASDRWDAPEVLKGHCSQILSTNLSAFVYKNIWRFKRLRQPRWY